MLVLLLHMDTTPDASGTNVRPWVLENYDGGDVLLNKERNIILESARFPSMKKYVGLDMIFTVVRHCLAEMIKRQWLQHDFCRIFMRHIRSASRRDSAWFYAGREVGLRHRKF